jgi:hypothetical protein
LRRAGIERPAVQLSADTSMTFCIVVAGFDAVIRSRRSVLLELE